MLGRVEQAEVGVVKKNAPYGIMNPVSQTEIKTIGGGPNGRFQFITYTMVLPVPHSDLSQSIEEKHYMARKKKMSVRYYGSCVATRK